MKYEKIIYSVGSSLIIASAIMKILHLPYSTYSNGILVFTFVGMYLFQRWQVTFLKKKVKELEAGKIN